MRTKSRRISGVKQWIESATKNPTSAYSLNKLDFNIDLELSKMTDKQLRLVMSLCAANYNRGCDETRKFWFPKYHAMREAAERATGQADISYSGLRLVGPNG